jgi:MFS family permease
MRQVPDKRITLLTSIGASLEYFDYVIYFLLANYISQQFFPTTNHSAALLATFSLFAASNFIRPIASTAIAILGDRYGRKSIFTNTLLFMALSSFLIGILPSTSSWGIVTTIIFCALRILQSVTFGAELPGALTFLLEHLRTKNRGLHCGLMVAAVGMGVTFGSWVIYLLTKFLNATQMQNWGFRVPFILGGLLALISFYIRRTISETPMFAALKEPTQRIMAKIGTNYLMQVIKGIGLVIFPASLVTFMLAVPTYLQDYYKFSASDTFLASTIGHFWAVIFIPIFGIISDRIGRKFLFVVTQIIVIVAGAMIFHLPSYGTNIALFVFVLLCQTIVALMAVSYFILLPEGFPTAVRYTGTALSYNLAYSFAAIVPVIANYIYMTLNQPRLIALLFAAAAMVSTISALRLKNYFE